MANVFVEEQSLVDVAAAIRTKNGTEEKYKPAEMAAAVLAIQSGSEPVIEALAITANGTYNAPDGVDGYSPITVNVPQEGAPTEEELTLTGNMSYRFYQDGWDWFLNKYGNQIKTEDITSLYYAFAKSNISKVPFVINGNNGSAVNLDSMCHDCIGLTTFPDIRNCNIQNMKNIISGCYYIKEIPKSFIENNTFSLISESTNPYSGNHSSIAYNTYSLRIIPEEFFNIYNRHVTFSNCIYYGSFNRCFVLDSLTNLPCYEDNAGWASNGFYNTFASCSRLNRLVFQKNEDGTCKTTKWKKQTIDLSANLGWAQSKSSITGYGIAADKEVKDDATYQALKNDADWFTENQSYSRYNHNSAVETINSLPDTSAYLTSTGGTNTIKYRGAAGSRTDGGAINTLTAEEIAVATAKGWTISLT